MTWTVLQNEKSNASDQFLPQGQAPCLQHSPLSSAAKTVRLIPSPHGCPQPADLLKVLLCGDPGQWLSNPEATRSSGEGGHIGEVGLSDRHTAGSPRRSPGLATQAFQVWWTLEVTGQSPCSGPSLPSDPCPRNGPAAPGAPGGRGLAVRSGCRSAALREAVLPRRRDTAHRIYIAAHRLALRQWCWESRVRGAVTRSRAAAEAQRTTQVAR